MSDRDVDIVAVANLVAGSFEATGHRVTGIHILSDTTAQVSADHHACSLDIREDVSLPGSSDRASVFISLRLLSPAKGQRAQFARDALLARALQALNDDLNPNFVQWIDSDLLLPGQTFAAATRTGKAVRTIKADVAERRIRSTKALPDVETTNAVLQDRISQHDPIIFDMQSSPERLKQIFSEGWIDPGVLADKAAEEAYAREIEDIEQEAPLRLSAWMFSFAVTFLALPIGVALLILNLAKGENLRLASQTAALTGTFVALQAVGATAETVTALQNLVN
jgi:hypothetical protein